jgi:hypothetical protein
MHEKFLGVVKNDAMLGKQVGKVKAYERVGEWRGDSAGCQGAYALHFENGCLEGSPL